MRRPLSTAAFVNVAKLQQKQQRWRGAQTICPAPDFFPSTPVYQQDVASPPSSTQLLMSAPAAPIVITRFGILNFLTAFVLGGIFFSAALAGVAAFVAVGKDNVDRFFRALGLVSSKVWQVFCLGLKETRAAMRLDGKWNWREAWEVLKLKLRETRQAVNEGVEAIRMEAKLFSAVVGAPGLIPIQYAVDRLLPFSIQTQMREAMVDVLRDLKNPNVLRATLEEFSVGTQSPQLEAARVYDLGSDAMAFDVDVNWDSDLEAKINVYTKPLNVKIPVTVKNIRFDGPVRVELTPLLDQPPGFGAALISFPSSPKIGLDVRVAGREIFKVRWLKRDILTGIQQALDETFLWPKRVVIPQEMATGTRQLLTLKQIKDIEQTDPLLKAEQALMEKSLIREMMQEPTTNTTVQLKVGVNRNDTESTSTPSERNSTRETVEVEATNTRWFGWLPNR